jgi:hypothetical protein
MIIRGLIAIVWAGLIAAGAVHISRKAKLPPGPPVASGGCLSQSEKSRLPHWTAVRALPVNWLVRTNDLRDPGGPASPGAAAFFGKYLVCKAAAGEIITESNLALRYAAPVVAGKVLFALPVSARDSSALNASNHISVLDGSEVVSNVEVAAIDCEASCTALLVVSPAESELLKAKKGMAMQVAPRKTGE